MYYLEKLSALISKYMAVLVIAIAAIALIEPMSFKWAAPNITMLLGIVMFGMGMTLKLADFKLVFQRPRDVFIGALAQFTIMPLLAYFLAKALHMDIAKAKAISIEVGMQNSGLATSLAMLHFGPAAAIPGAIFSVWHNISGSLAANYLSSKMNKEELPEVQTAK